MDKDEVLKLAKQAGFFPEMDWDRTGWHAAGHDITFEVFAKLVEEEAAKREREAFLDLVGFYKGSTEIKDALLRGSNETKV